MCHERRRIIGQVDEKQKDSVQCEGEGRVGPIRTKHVERIHNGNH